MFRENECKISIVIVNQELREQVLQNLKKTAFQISEVNPQSALESLGNHCPDLIILDVFDEKSENLKIIRELKQNKTSTEINVLQISPENLFNENGAIDKFESFADVFLAEPFNPPNLISMLRALLRCQESKNLFKTNENRYRAAAEADSQLVWWTGDLNQTENNLMKWWDEVTGQPFDAVRGWGWLSVVHPEDRDLAQTAWQYAFDNLTECEVEYRVKGRDGKYRYLSVRGIPILNANGEASEWIVTGKEVTKDRETENLLSQQNALLELSHEPIFVWDIDKGIINWNRGCEELYRFTKAEAIGQTSHKLLKTRFPISYENYRESLEKNGFWTGELRHLARNNHEIIVESRQIYVKTPSGQSLVLESNRDITEREQNELRLRSSEERYRAFIKQSTEGIWRAELQQPIAIDLPVAEQIDLFYKYAYIAECNDAMANMYGLESAENLVGARLGDLIVRDDPKNYDYFRDFIVSNYRLTEAETHEKQADGTDVYFLNNLIGIVENKHLLRAWGTQRDITVQRTVEKALRRSEQRYRGLIELSGQIIYLRSANGRRVEFVNQKWRDYTGLEIDEIDKIGGLALLHPDDVERVAQTRKEHFERGQSYSVENRLLGVDGEYRWFLTRVLPLKNEAGQITNWLGMMIDIHERKLAEEKIQAANERFQIAEEASNGFLYDWNLTTKTVVRSQTLTKVLGYSQNDINNQGPSWAGYIHPDDLELAQQAFDQACNDGGKFMVEYRARHKNGDYIYMLDRGLVVRDANGGAVRVIGSAVDINERKQIENALRESEERFRQLAENLDNVFWVTRWHEGKPTEIEYVSPAPERLWGIKPNFIRENLENWVNLIHPADLERIQEENRKIVADGKFEAEYRIVLPSGQIRWVHDWGVAVRDVNGNIERTVGSAEDITERREIARTLIETEERMRLAMQAADMFTWDLDLLNNQFQWSENAERLLGFLPSTLPLNLETLFEFVNGEDIERVKHDIAAALNENKSYNTEFRLVNSDGGQVWVRSNGVIIRNAMNEPVRFVGISQNITKRKIADDEIWRLNQELQKRIAELQTLLNVLPVGVSIADDISLERISANRYLTAALGLPDESNISANNEEINQNYGWRFFHEGTEIFSEDLPIQQAIGRQELIEKFEFDVQMRHKPPVSLLANAAPLYNDDGQVRGAIAGFVDITERKRVENERDELLEREQAARREAEFANRAKDEFLAVLSHELRTPLNAMYGWVRMLSAGTLDSTMQKRAIEVIERNIQLQTKLIEDILDVSRIVSGKIKLDLRRLEVVSLVNSVVEMSRPAANAKQIVLEAKSESQEPLVIFGDAERLQQVLSNLINNAVKFTSSGGQIIVQIARRESVARVSVIDNGVGIQADFLPHVFDRFKQADSSSKRKHGGLGLGLAIVKHLTELHHGSVAAESLGENLGATFTIELPLAANESVETEENKSNGNQADDNLFENMRVLTVEDELDASEMLNTLLTAHQAIVTSANSAKEALQILQKDNFDLLISDIGMPEMDGLEFIRQLRADEDTTRKNLLAIALTAYVGADDRQRILAAGFNDCLAKPIDFNFLQNAVAKFLNPKNSEQEA